MQLLFESYDRSVYFVPGSSPAVFFLADREGGGILINSPRYSPELLASLETVLPLKFIFYPSYLGARDADVWREASGAQTMAYGHEAKRIDGT
ncbi:MAG TPA: hypothetical protein VFN66_03540, partial [Burkholderiales bacterium]|nr:hypothetical protein [Burkholderiales bacterium]